MRQIYLDYNATTPVAVPVYEAMQPFLAEHYGDPSAMHVVGRTAREAIEDSRGRVAQVIGADRDEIVFTSGGTESNNLAILGTLLNPRHRGGHLVISAIEHASVMAPARFLEELGYEISVLPVTGQGAVTPSTLRGVLREDTVLVSVMHANHETGAIQPIRQIAEICHAQGVLLHTDASQTLGKIRLHVQELDVDLLSFTGHKCYGPKGVGGLYVRHGVHLEPLFHGAGQEGGLRPGTENVAGIVGLGTAVQLVARNLDESHQRLLTLRDHLLQMLRAGAGENLVLHSELAPRLPNVLSVAFRGAGAVEMLGRLPELFAAPAIGPDSAGAVLGPLTAMGVKPDLVKSSLRLSLGWHTTEDDIDRAAGWLLHAWESLR
jgi:cysteine desulfurase